MRVLIVFVGLLLLLIHSAGRAQSTSDCPGAIELCSDYYFETTAAPSYGNIYEFTGTCNANLEVRSVWYTFTTQSAGMLSFILDPVNDLDDYDWGLFNITNGGCGGLGNTSPQVSCNSWGTFGTNSPTGISSALGGSGNNNGPGTFNGPQYNGDFFVNPGETFALVVMNWSNSTGGYSIDFSGSSAVLYDNVPPLPLTTQALCGNTTLELHFNEAIVMSSVQALDFQISGPGGTYSVVQAQSLTPGASSSSTLLLTLDQAITTPGTYTLGITTASGLIEDSCGNLGFGSVTFEVYDPLSFTATTTNACNGFGGSATVAQITGGNLPVQLWMENQPQQGLTITQLQAGSYTLTLIDEDGCSATQQVSISNHELGLIIPEQQSISCINNPHTMTGVVVLPAQEVTYQWSSPNGGNIVSGATTTNAVVDVASTYFLTVTHAASGCSYVESIEIVSDETVDLIAPEIVNVTSDCSGQTLVVTFSEPVVTATVQANDLVLILGAVTYTIASVAPQNANAALEQTFTIQLVQPVQWSGLHQLTLSTSTNGIEDQCGNVAIGSFPIQLYMPLSFSWSATDGCNDLPASLSITTPSGGMLPVAYTLNGALQAGNTNNNLSTGTYTMLLTDARNCTASATAQLVVHELTAKLYETDSLTCIRETVEINTLVTYPEQPMMYSWTSSEGLQSFASGLNAAAVTVNAPGIYTVTVTNPNTACFDTAQIEVGASPEFDIDLSSITLPNIITPNGDGKNEAFEPFLAADPQYNLTPLFDVYELTIFNRWGNEIFQAASNTRAWNAANAEAGTYYYTIRIESNCGTGTKTKKSGHLQVVR